MPKHKNETHGMSFSGKTPHPLYRVWGSMKGRCKRNKYYSRVEICKEWVNSFESFYGWAISNGWKKGLQVDRINSDGNYEPSNCQIVTCAENIRRKKTTKLNHEKVSMIKLLMPGGYTNKELGHMFNIDPSTISRINTGKRWGGSLA